MIVRDEAAVLRRCVRSALPLIDAWVICDTGSTDGTPELVGELLGDLPGQLHHRAWQDFGTNRSELMALAHGAADYLLLLDADMVVELSEPFPTLSADAYSLLQREGELIFAMPRLVRGDLPWRYEGATHEYLTLDRTFRTESLPELTVLHHADGGSRADKLTRDRRLLEEQLLRRPDDPRTLFYLAQTYRDLGESALALSTYRQRITVGGWDQEIYYSALQVGLLVAAEYPDAGLALLLEAWEKRPTRAEPLYHVAALARSNDRPHLAHMVTSVGIGLELPVGELFVDEWIYKWGLRFEHAIACGLVGDLENALRINDELLVHAVLPGSIRFHTERNRQWCAEQLVAQGRPVPPPVPGLTVDASETAVLSELADDAALVRLGGISTTGACMNPSVAGDAAGFRAIVRTVNYRLGPRGQYLINDQAGVVRTVNHLAHFDTDLNLISSAPIDESKVPGRQETPVRGFEDCRLFRWEGRWWALATCRDLSPDAVNQIVLLGLEGSTVDSAVVLEGPHPGRYEKNWMPFVHDGRLQVVYGCFPFSVREIDHLSGATREIFRWDTPRSWDNIRGGSQGLPLESGGYLFVVHEAHERGGVRVYRHRFLQVGADLTPLSLSGAFGLARDGIEFCAGLAQQGDSLILSAGLEDSEAVFVRVPMAVLEKLPMEPVVARGR